MSKKFLSDVLIECGLQVSGTTTLGTATATTVATSDNSTNIATTAWVKALGYSTTDSFISNVSLSGSTLSFTGINSAFTGSIDLSTLSTQLTDVETVYASVRNVSGVLIPKGTPLATVIGQTSGNVSDVVPADASDPAFMPALFVADEDIAEEAEGRAVAYGEITGIDTSLYPSGTTVYVAPGGGWTDIKPTGTDLIQNLGVITKQHNTNGGGIVTGVGRSNDVPNIPQGYAWVGNANGVATPTLLGSLAYSSATYDNYGSWNLKTNGVQRTTVQSGGNLDIVAGTDISVSYGAGGVVTINSTATGSIDYVSDVALNGNSLDFTGTGNAFAGSIDLSSLTPTVAVSALTDVDLTGLANNSILKYDSTAGEWIVGTNSTAQATANVIRPFAYAHITLNNYTANSGIAMSWGTYQYSAGNYGYYQFTFSNAQANANYAVMTDMVVAGDINISAEVTNRTTTGFRVNFYDSNGTELNVGSVATYEPIIQVYSSNPVETIYADSYSSIGDLPDVDTTTSAPSNGEALVWDGTNWVPGTISTTNNYLTGLSFNTGDGVLTATRQGLSDLTVDLDGRYLTSFDITTQTDTKYLRSDVDDTFGDASKTLTIQGVVRSNNNGNIYGPNFNVSTTNKDTAEYAYRVDRSGTVVGGITIGGQGKFADGMTVGAASFTANTINNWNTAYGWGDHALQGYLTSYTETDTLDTVADRGATTDKSLTIGNTLTLTRTGGVATLNTNTSGNDPQFIRFDESTDNSGFVWIAVSDDFDVSAANDVFYIGDSNLTDWRFKVLGSGAIYSREGTTERQLATRDWVTSQSYITGYTETDPIFTASAASGIAAGDITNWDSAYGWGNHGTAGYLLASQMTNYSLNPRFSTSIGFSNDTEILQFQDNNGQTKAGYWTSLDAFLINGDGNSNTNILLKTGNIYVNQNQFIVGKLGVQGLIELDNNSGVTLYSNGGTGDPAGVKIESFDSAAFIGAFLDFTIYDDGKDHMRSGTLQIVFNAAEVRFNEVNTLDIGDTSGCTLDVQNNGGIAEVYFTTPDPTFNIKYQVRTL